MLRALALIGFALTPTLLSAQDGSAPTPAVVVLVNDSVRVGEPARLTVRMRDPKPGVQYTLDVSPQPLRSRFKPSTGELIWTPDVSEGGEYDFSVTATEPSARYTASKKVKIVQARHAPTIEVGGRSVRPGETATIQARVEDLDGDSIMAVSCKDSRHVCNSWNEALRTLTFTAPNSPTDREYPVTLVAIDARGDSGQSSFSLTVSGAPASPTVTLSPKTKSAKEGDVVVFTYSSVDLNGDPLQEKVVDSPAGAEIDPLKHTVTWTIPYSFVSEFGGSATAIVAVRVTDGSTMPAGVDTARVLVRDAVDPTDSQATAAELAILDSQADKAIVDLSAYSASLERVLHRQSKTRAVISWGTFLTSLGVITVQMASSDDQTKKQVAIYAGVPTAIFGFWGTRLSSDDDTSKARLQAESLRSDLAAKKRSLAVAAVRRLDSPDVIAAKAALQKSVADAATFRTP